VLAVLFRKLTEHAVYRVFGERGVALRKMAESIDLDHPDSDELFRIGDPTFGKELFEVARLTELASPFGHFDTLAYTGHRILTKTKARRRFMKTVGEPAAVRRRVRLLADPDDRLSARNKRQPQHVSIWPLFNKGEAAWAGTPQDFTRYLRGERLYGDEIRSVRDKRDRFRSLGCDCLAAEADAVLKVLESSEDDQHYGFIQVSMGTAALILAKMHGWELVESDCWMLQKSVVDFYPFQVDKVGRVNYQPTAYSIDGSGIIPPAAKKIMALCEAWPGHGKPIFDYYHVFIPGVHYPLFNESDGYYKVRSVEGQELDFLSYEEASNFLDLSLVQAKSVVPALLGEKDGKTYFICMWE